MITTSSNIKTQSIHRSLLTRSPSATRLLKTLIFERYGTASVTRGHHYPNDVNNSKHRLQEQQLHPKLSRPRRRTNTCISSSNFITGCMGSNSNYSYSSASCKTSSDTSSVCTPNSVYPSRKAQSPASATCLPSNRRPRSIN